MKLTYFRFEFDDTDDTKPDRGSLTVSFGDLTALEGVEVLAKIGDIVAGRKPTFVVEQKFAEGFDPDRVAAALARGLGAHAERMASTPAPAATATATAAASAPPDMPFEGSTPIVETPPAEPEKKPRTRKASTRHPVEHTTVAAAPPLTDAFYAEIVDTGIADGVPHTRVLEAIQTKLTSSFLVGSGPSEADLIAYVKGRYAAAAERAASAEVAGDYDRDDVDGDDDGDTGEIDDLFAGPAAEPEPAKAAAPPPAKSQAASSATQSQAATPAPQSQATGADAELIAKLSGVTGMAAFTRTLKSTGMTPDAAFAFVMRHITAAWVPKLARSQFTNASPEACLATWNNFWNQAV